MTWSELGWVSVVAVVGGVAGAIVKESVQTFFDRRRAPSEAARARELKRAERREVGREATLQEVGNAVDHIVPEVGILIPGPGNTAVAWVDAWITADARVGGLEYSWSRKWIHVLREDADIEAAVLDVFRRRHALSRSVTEGNEDDEVTRSLVTDLYFALIELQDRARSKAAG